MRYYDCVIRDTMEDIRCRALTRKIRADHELKALYDYLGENEVEVFYEQLKANTLPEQVRDQYDLFCGIVEELVR